MYPIKQATDLDLMIFICDTDGEAVTGLVNGDFTKRISKDGGAFGAWSVTITEAEGGFYSLTLSDTDTSTIGILTCYVTASGAIQQNLQWRVETRILDTLAFPTVPGRSMDVNSDGTVDPDFDQATGTIDGDSQITGWTAMVAALAAVLVDTAELQTDWADGGRLDVIQDAIKAVTDVLNNFDPSSDQVIVSTLNDKTGLRLSATGVDDILDEVVENSKTLRQYLIIMKAALAGKSAGGGTSTNTFRDDADGKNVISAGVDSDGNRGSVSLNP